MTDPAEHEALLRLLGSRIRGVLTTLKRDGRPQMSVVGYHYDPQRQLIRISVTDTRAKTRNLRRDPRASFLVAAEDLGSFVVVESTAQMTPVTTDPYDATAEELVDHYRALRGEHSDWDEFRRAMVDDQRLILSLPVERIYGWAGENR